MPDLETPIFEKKETIIKPIDVNALMDNPVDPAPGDVLVAETQATKKAKVAEVRNALPKVEAAQPEQAPMPPMEATAPVAEVEEKPKLLNRIGRWFGIGEKLTRAEAMNVIMNHPTKSKAYELAQSQGRGDKLVEFFQKNGDVKSFTWSDKKNEYVDRTIYSVASGEVNNGGDSIV